MTPAVLVGWREVQKGSLRGFARVRFPDLCHAELSDIAIHVAGSRVWASPPARPWIEDGRTVTDPRTGKPQYQPIVHFPTHGCRRRWSDAVVAALREAKPELLLPEEPDGQNWLLGGEL